MTTDQHFLESVKEGVFTSVYCVLLENRTVSRIDCFQILGGPQVTLALSFHMFLRDMTVEI